MRRIALTVAIVVVASGLALAAPQASVDNSTSAALTKYLHKNRLPLVRAQVSVTPDGSRRILLYGFVATDFGKHDAEKKARHYLHDQTAAVDNHIHVDPAIRHLKKYNPSPLDQGGAPPPAAGPQQQPPKSADWENDVDTYLNRGGIKPSNDPNLNMPGSE